MAGELGQCVGPWPPRPQFPLNGTVLHRAKYVQVSADRTGSSLAPSHLLSSFPALETSRGAGRLSLPGAVQFRHAMLQTHQWPERTGPSHTADRALPQGH